MKKSILLAFLILTILTILSSCSSSDSNIALDNNSNQTVNSVSQPERKTDIYGKITSQEGSEITLLQVDTSKDPTFDMDPTQKKKYMQSLDESARMALKEEINTAILGEVKVMIPVGIGMVKKAASGPDSETIEASLTDLKIGGYLSIWLNGEITDQKIAEFVKISFVQ